MVDRLIKLIETNESSFIVGMLLGFILGFISTVIFFAMGGPGI